jgi:hypothetical protein
LVRIVLTGNLSQFTGGETEINLAAGNIRQLFELLAARHPDIKPLIEADLAVAIDGRRTGRWPRRSNGISK